jgi:DNA-binding NarL/FixJ family response regulator
MASQVSNDADRTVGSAVDRPLRVFLVEDSPVIRDRLIEAIASLPHVVVAGIADTEAEAISILQRTPCDAVVLDLQLRRGHGFNVLKSLRAASERPRLIIIVLTNFTSPQYRDRSMGMGADYFFDKARDLDRVSSVLEELALARDRSIS